MVSTRSHVTPTPTKSSNPDATAPIPCLVTGGAGFLGKTLCRQLVASGRYDVTVFDINPSHVPGVEDVKGDLTDKAQVQRAVQGKRVIFHVATASPTGANARNRSLMQRVNVLGTENILEAAIQEVSDPEGGGVIVLSWIYFLYFRIVYTDRNFIGVLPSTRKQPNHPVLIIIISLYESVSKSKHIKM